ncbi:hypothetical protein [Serinibacter arcticus]|uniref:Uncharacterized protein n=1 Tax=Serinibacter arcticus TaxID=1655435 RepID=A0A4Z1E0Y6_9MICO|nr:hypothetical protein [Serinibacter arcticus]TGO05605.1 hypothetical protein SERN_1609 [Serinibacter arcticus]
MTNEPRTTPDGGLDEPATPAVEVERVEATPVVDAAEAAPAEPATSEPATPEPEREIVSESAAVAGLADRSRVRRAPRFGAFLFAGLFLAAFVAGLLSFVRDSTLPPEALAGRALDSWGMFWLLLIGLGAFFALASYTVATWFDRRSVRRMERGPRS